MRLPVDFSTSCGQYGLKYDRFQIQVESPKGIHSLVMRHAGLASLLMDRVPSRRDKLDGSDPHKGGQGMPQTL